MNGPLPALPDAQVAAAFRDAGFWGDNLITMVAVALAESGGDPDNMGDESLANAKWGPSIGLAQIRSLWADRGTGRARDPDRLDEAPFNARSAWDVSSGGTNFRPWTMWTNRRYLNFIDRARAAVGGGGDGGGAGGGGGGSWGPEGGAGAPGAGIVDRFVAPLLEGAGRITLVGLAVAGGAALIAAGAWRGTDAGEKIRGAVTGGLA